MITVTNLRKIFTEQGVKGASSWNRATFEATINDAHEAANLEAERLLLAKTMSTPKKGICEDCGRKVGKSGHPTLCTPCYDYAGWENTHNDSGHDTDASAPKEERDDCPICHPDLDPRKPVTKSRSRAGMVIVAKGSEIHKSQTFKVAAEAAGWTVKVMDTFEGTKGDENARYYADAHRGEDAIQLAWDGRAYDYPASSARLNGKDKKVRNLKEALRLLVN